MKTIDLSKVCAEGMAREIVMTPEIKTMVDQIIRLCGPEELYEISKILQKAADDDIESSMRQIEEDNRKEIAWVQSH